MTQLHHVLHRTEQAVAIPLPSLSAGILQSSLVHLLVLQSFLRQSPLRPVELGVAPYLASDTSELYENSQYQGTVTRLFLESPVLSCVTKLHPLSAYPLPATGDDPVLRSCLLQLAQAVRDEVHIHVDVQMQA